LSGAGKTTLSADPHCALIGDDKHEWDKDGMFNFEGGCYAKTINLTEKTEPDVCHAIKTDALLENVKLNEVNIALFFLIHFLFPISVLHHWLLANLLICHLTIPSTLKLSCSKHFWWQHHHFLLANQFQSILEAKCKSD